MANEIMKRFALVVAFLGKVLGPDYEITLYDLESELHAVAAIANGRVGGQTVGSSLPETVQKLLSEKQYEQGDYVTNFTSHLQVSGKPIRSSAMFIKDDTGKPIGLLGINFDDSRFLSVANDLLRMVHPLGYGATEGPAAEAVPTQRQRGIDEAIHNDVSGLIEEIFHSAARTLSVPIERLTQEERVAFLAQLKSRGMFRLKGSVQYAAVHLACSQASIYRYLSKLKEEEHAVNPTDN